jgi:hypothetical protein
LDQPQAYVVVGPNDQRGPYTLELLIGEVLAGRLHDATPVWWPGLAEWTTMSGHPGVAAEIARRRAGYADPTAYAAPAQPSAYDAPQQTAGQYEQAQQAGWDSGAAQPVQAPAGQDYSAGTYAAQSAPAPVAEQPAPDPYAAAPVTEVASTPGLQPEAAAVAEEPAPAAAVPSGWTVSEPAPEVVAPDQVHAPQPAPSVAPEHQAAFDALVARSGARAAAADRVREVDTALADAVAAGAESQGFQEADRTAGDANHDIRFDGAPGESLGITLGRIKGDDVASLRNGQVPLTVRYQSAQYGGGLDAGHGTHGEVVVVSDEWSGQATATVSLLLPLADYLNEDLSVDAVGVLRDVGAAVAVVRGRLA